MNRESPRPKPRHPLVGRLETRIRSRIHRGTVLAAVFLAAAPVAGGDTTVSVVPSATTVVPGEPVTIEVVVSGLGDAAAPSVGAFDLDLAYDPALFAFTGLEVGAELGDPMAAEAITDSMEAGGVIDAFELSLLTSAELLTAQPSEFVLLTATFEALVPGSGQFDLPMVVLGDENGVALPATVLPATVSSGTILEIPTLSPILLLALLLALFGVGVTALRRRES